MATIWGTSGVFAAQVQRHWEQQAAHTQQQASESELAAQALERRAQQADRRALQLQQEAADQRLLRRAWTRHRARSAARQAQSSRLSADRQRDLRVRYEQQALEQQGSARAAQAGLAAELEVLEALAACPGVQDLVCGLQMGPAGGDIDIVVLGARPLVVEVKAGYGQLQLQGSAEGTRVLHGGKPVVGDPLGQLARQVQMLRQAGVPEVVGLLALPAASGGVLQAPDGTWVAGGVRAVQQAVARLLGPPRQQPFGPQQLFEALDRHLAQLQAEQQAKMQEVQRRLAYRDAKCREWEAKLVRWRTWNTPDGMRMKARVGALLRDAAVKQAGDQQYLQRLAQHQERWVQTRRDNAALQQIRQVG